MKKETKVIISAETSKYERGMRNIKRTSKSTANAITNNWKKAAGAMAAITGATAGLHAIIKNITEEGDRLHKLTKNLNISGEALQGLEYAAGQSGLEINRFDKAMQTMNRRISFAVRDTGAAKAAFESLGVNVEKLNELTADEQLLFMADRLREVKNEADKSAYMFEIFGLAGVQMNAMLKNGSVSLKEMIKEKKSMGVMDDELIQQSADLTDAMDDLSQKWKSLTYQVGPPLLNMFGKVVGTLSSIVDLWKNLSNNKKIELEVVMLTNEQIREKAKAMLPENEQKYIGEGGRFEYKKRRETKWENKEKTAEQIAEPKGKSRLQRYLDQIKEEQNYNKMMEGVRQKYYEQLLTDIKTVDEKKLEIKKSFNEQYAEIGKTSFEVERNNLIEQIKLWEDAGIKQTQIAQLISAKFKQIKKQETIYALGQASQMAAGVANSFMQMAQAGSEHSKKAFRMYQAFAIAQAVMNTAQLALAGGASLAALPFIGPALAAAWIPTAYAIGAAQIAMIASAKPPSYDQGGISNAKGVYQTGNIAEAHIPIPSGGKIPVQIDQQKQPVQIILNNPTFQDIETQQQVMAQIAEFVAEKVAPGAVVENYNNDGIVRQMTRNGY